MHLCREDPVWEDILGHLTCLALRVMVADTAGCLGSTLEWFNLYNAPLSLLFPEKMAVALQVFVLLLFLHLRGFFFCHSDSAEEYELANEVSSQRIYGNTDISIVSP